MISQSLRAQYATEKDLETAVKRGKIYKSSLKSGNYLHAKKSGKNINWFVTEDESGRIVKAKGTEFMG